MGFDLERYERNLIGGDWQFPKAPYDYETRSPADSRVIATVPLSSRLDVSRAVEAAGSAAVAWSDPGLRAAVRDRFEELVRRHSFDLAELQATETGLLAQDSSALVLGCLSTIQAIDPGPGAGLGIQGHVLACGFPVLELALSVLEPLFAGACVVVKPSLRAPLSAAALAELLVDSGLPAGALNVVQGLGTDVGAALVSDPGVGTVAIRGSASTVERAAERAQRRGAAVVTSTGAEQLLVVGPDADPEEAGAIVSAGIRAGSAGGPLGLDRLLVHRQARDELLSWCRAALVTIEPAPLATEAARKRVEGALAAALAAGAHTVAGGTAIPDDGRHRMGWYHPPALVEADDRSLLDRPTGPVAAVSSWSDPAEVEVGPMALAVVVGIDPAELDVPPGALIATDAMHDLVCAGRVAAGWRNHPWGS